MIVIPSVLMNSVRYREVSAIKHVRYREVPLYTLSFLLGITEYFHNGTLQYFVSIVLDKTGMIHRHDTQAYEYSIVEYIYCTYLLVPLMSGNDMKNYFQQWFELIILFV